MISPMRTERAKLLCPDCVEHEGSDVFDGLCARCSAARKATEVARRGDDPVKMSCERSEPNGDGVREARMKRNPMLE